MGILSPLGFCNFLKGNSSMLRFLHSSNSNFRFLGSNVNESYNYRTSQPISAGAECRTRGLFARCRKPSSASQELFYSTHDSRIITCSASHNSKIILGSDAKGEILTSLGSKHHVTVIVFDLETTGFSRKKDRIIEIAFRDLRGGMNSCFETLVNPEQIVPNSHVHGITTEMVNQPEVPRMNELIPIIVKYIKSRQIPGRPVFLVAHNARNFDLPFLENEFRRCSYEIPEDWTFIDSCLLAREAMKLEGLSNF